MCAAGEHIMIEWEILSAHGVCWVLFAVFLDWIFKQRNGTFSVLVQIGRQTSKQRFDFEALEIIVNP